MMKHICTTAILGMTITSAASAALYQFEWNVGDTAPDGLNNTGGEVRQILGAFNTETNRLDWQVTYADQITEGLTLAISPGANPKNHPGELAMIYFDAYDHDNTRLTAYGYNGLNSHTSWYDGDGATAGDQDADLIMTNNMPMIFSQLAIDHEDGSRTLGFSIDATNILAHHPMWPSFDENVEWTGAQFAERIGIWQHSFTRLRFEYGDGGDITSLIRGGQGWFDGHDMETNLVPTPGTAALALAGGMTAFRRRRN